MHWFIRKILKRGWRFFHVPLIIWRDFQMDCSPRCLLKNHHDPAKRSTWYCEILLALELEVYFAFFSHIVEVQQKPQIKSFPESISNCWLSHLKPLKINNEFQGVQQQMDKKKSSNERQRSWALFEQEKSRFKMTFFKDVWTRSFCDVSINRSIVVMFQETRRFIENSVTKKIGKDLNVYICMNKDAEYIDENNSDWLSFFHIQVTKWPVNQRIQNLKLLESRGCVWTWTSRILWDWGMAICYCRKRGILRTRTTPLRWN
jgi:hypothetical protein